MKPATFRTVRTNQSGTRSGEAERPGDVAAGDYIGELESRTSAERHDRWTTHAPGAAYILRLTRLVMSLLTEGYWQLSARRWVKYCRATIYLPQPQKDLRIESAVHNVADGGTKCLRSISPEHRERSDGEAS